MSAAVNPLVREMFDHMRSAQGRQPLQTWSLRAARLRALETLVRTHRDAIVAAISADFGHRAPEETDLFEVFPSLGGIRYALKHGRRWMRPRRQAADFWFLPARTALMPQPRGVVGIIVPWNYPLYLAVGPMVDALVAGNRVLVKLSEFTPCFSSLFAELVAEYFSADEVRIVNGPAEVAREFSSLPFDHLFFTGSTAVGHEVMRAAAANLTPVTLELGGKSPAIIGPGARFAHAVERIMVGKLVNAGQTCIAPDYVLLPRAQIPAFIETARAVVARLYPDLASNAQYTHIASDRHYARLTGLVEGAQARGATAHPLAVVDAAAGTRLLPPTLLVDVDQSMAVMQQELFGPLLPLLPYDSLDEALAYITAQPHPLALYVFEQDRKLVDHVLGHTRAGGVTVNDTLYHIAQHDLPFGGVGSSGMGACHGEAGFRAFSHMKPVFYQSRWNATGLLNPPYGATFRRMLRLLLGR